MFGVFERGDTKTEGTGIGLANCKRAIEHLGGRIWYESELGNELGKGTKFFFAVPDSQARQLSTMPPASNIDPVRCVDKVIDKCL